jgi:excisionase family DNA binding protein
MAEIPEDIITVTEASKLLRVSRQMLAKYIKQGQLRAYRLSDNPKGRIRLSKRDVLALLVTVKTVTPYDLAVARVDASATLRPCRDFILGHWPQGDEHWRWVATATEHDIIAWAATETEQDIVDWAEAGEAEAAKP